MQLCLHSATVAVVMCAYKSHWLAVCTCHKAARLLSGIAACLQMQVTQIRIAGDPSYDTRYAFIEFTTPEEVGAIVAWSNKAHSPTGVLIVLLAPFMQLPLTVPCSRALGLHTAAWGFKQALCQCPGRSNHVRSSNYVRSC